MIYTVWQSFPRFLVVFFFLMKMLLEVELMVFWKRVGNAEKTKYRLLHVWVATGDSLSRQRRRRCQVLATVRLGRDRGFQVTTEFVSWLCVTIGIPVSRHGSQILSNGTCHNMVFFVAIGILVLYHDNVTTEVFLSQPR